MSVKKKKLSFCSILTSFSLCFIPISTTLSSCSIVNVTTYNVSVVSAADIVLSNNKAQHGKLFETDLIQNCDESLQRTFSSIVVFCGGKELVEGKNKDFCASFNHNKTKCHLSIFSPTSHIKILVTTSWLDRPITYNCDDPVNIYNLQPSPEPIYFNYNDSQMPDQNVILNATVIDADDTWNENFDFSPNPVVIDDVTKIFSVGIIKKPNATIDEDWVGNISIKFLYLANGILKHCEVNDIPINYHNQQRGPTIEMLEEDKNVVIRDINDVKHYSMILNEDVAPINGCVNIKLLTNEPQLNDKYFYLDKSIVDVERTESGKLQFDADLKMYVSPDKIDDFVDYELSFDFEISYIRHDFSFQKVIASYDGKQQKNKIKLVYTKVLIPYRETTKYLNNKYDSLWYECECPRVNIKDINSLEIKVLKPESTNETEILEDRLEWDSGGGETGLGIDYYFVGKKRILRIPICLSSTGCEQDVAIIPFKLEFKVTDSEGTKSIIKWYYDKEEQNLSPIFNFVEAKPIPTEYLDIRNNEVYGFTSEGIKILDSSGDQYNCLLFPKYITSIKANAFASSSSSGKCLKRWSHNHLSQNKQTILFFPDVDDVNWKLTYIHTSAFEGQNEFSGELALPSSVIYIGRYAFKNCSTQSNFGFSSLSFGTYEYSHESTRDTFITTSRLQFIGKQAFRCDLQDSTCKSSYRGNLILPNSLITMEDECFYGCGFDGVVHFSKSYNWSQINKSIFAECRNLIGIFTTDYILTPSPIPHAILPEKMLYNCKSFTGMFEYNDEGEVEQTNKFYIDKNFTRVNSNCLTNTPIEMLEIDGTNITNIASGAFNNMTKLYQISFWYSNPLDQKYEGFIRNNYDQRNFENAGIDASVADKTHIALFSSEGVDESIGTYLKAKYKKKGKLYSYRWIPTETIGGNYE